MAEHDNAEPPSSDYLENRTFDELAIDESATLVRQLTERDIQLFAAMSGDINPAHLDEEFAREEIFHEIVAHGMWAGSLFSNLLGTQMPGPGTIYLSQDLKFLKPICLGDTVTVTVTVSEKRPEKKQVIFDCRCTNQRGEVTISGQARVLAPTQKIRRRKTELPEVYLHRKGAHLEKFIEQARPSEPLPMAIVHPTDTLSLLAAIRAADAGLIEPVLVGPRERIDEAAATAKVDIDGYEIVNSDHSHDSAERAVELVRAGHVQALMKGKLPTDELMGAVGRKDGGLRTERQLSHVFMMDVPRYPRPILVTDAVINVAPTLSDKVDIVQNAIDLGIATGIDQPKVAVLCAREIVDAKVTCTLDASALCKMAERGQIVGGLLDGPLAFDNALDPNAAMARGIQSPVAGEADVLVAPDLEAANMLARQLESMADANGAGVLMGARVPIALTSRFVDELTRLASCAMAVAVHQYNMNGNRQEIP